jgi:O-antigen/teichoic acid export membrane protein
MISKALNFVRKEKGLAYTVAGNIGASLLGAVFWLLLASVLKVDEYGEVNYYIALATIPVALGSLGLNTAITTYLAKGDEEVVREADSIALISGSALAMLVIPFHWSLSLLVLAMMFYAMSIAEILGRKAYGEFAVVSVSSKLTQIILSIILYFKFGLIGVLMGYFLAPLLFSYRYFSCLRNFTVKINSLREKANFTLHSYGFNLVGSFSNCIDKIIVGAVFGLSALGIYQLGFQFFMFLSIMPASLSMYLLPEESSGGERKEAKLVGFTLSAAAALAVFLLSPWIVRVFFPKFAEAVPVIRVMSLAIMPATINSMLAAKLFGKEKSNFVLIGGLIYISCLATTLMLFGKAIGLTGLAASILLAQSTQTIYLWSSSRRP